MCIDEVAMALVLTTASSVLCGLVAPKLHGGTVVLTSAAKLAVSGSPVLVASSLGVVTPGTCKTVPPPPANKPCTKVVSVMPACIATKLQASGSGGLLDTPLSGATDGVPPGPLAATVNQGKLTAM
jgi:hypothetical protein